MGLHSKCPIRISKGLLSLSPLPSPFTRLSRSSLLSATINGLLSPSSQPPVKAVEFLPLLLFRPPLILYYLFFPHLKRALHLQVALLTSIIVSAGSGLTSLWTSKQVVEWYYLPYIPFSPIYPISEKYNFSNYISLSNYSNRPMCVCALACMLRV